ncbi:hypothetical protein [Limnohabitans sp.]|uniref:hypothetical protein n=1 Tax=Limnohabitans sp. TaxID=1907725 RepID=UPI00286F9E4D|nr:hypothetical protein [Limnohabitans sp.]
MEAPIDLQTELQNNPELAMMLLDTPIAFNPIYAEISESVLAALMLSVLTEQAGELQTTSDGWVIFDERELTFLTKMTTHEQFVAREILRSKELILERSFNDQRQISVNHPKITHAIVMLARLRTQQKAQYKKSSQPH